MKMFCSLASAFALMFLSSHTFSYEDALDCFLGTHQGKNCASSNVDKVSLPHLELKTLTPITSLTSDDSFARDSIYEICLGSILGRSYACDSSNKPKNFRNSIGKGVLLILPTPLPIKDFDRICEKSLFTKPLTPTTKNFDSSCSAYTQNIVRPTKITKKNQRLFDSSAFDAESFVKNEKMKDAYINLAAYIENLSETQPEYLCMIRYSSKASMGHRMAFSDLYGLKKNNPYLIGFINEYVGSKKRKRFAFPVKQDLIREEFNKLVLEASSGVSEVGSPVSRSRYSFLADYDLNDEEEVSFVQKPESDNGSVSALLAECSTIKDQEQKLFCFELAAKVDQSKERKQSLPFTDEKKTLAGGLRKARTRISNGISYKDYPDLLADLDEVIQKVDFSSKERSPRFESMLLESQLVHQILQDARTLWDYKFVSREISHWLHGGIMNETINGFVSLYPRIPLTEYRCNPGSLRIVDGVSHIWSVASEKSIKLEKFLR